MPRLQVTLWYGPYQDKSNVACLEHEDPCSQVLLISIWSMGSSKQESVYWNELFDIGREDLADVFYECTHILCSSTQNSIYEIYHKEALLQKEKYIFLLFVQSLFVF